MTSIRSCAYKRINGTQAGTAVILDHPGTLERILLGQNKTGTVSFYDCAVSTGTAATNLIFTVDNTSGTIASSVDCGFGVKTGLTAVTGGTTDMTVVFS